MPVVADSALACSGIRTCANEGYSSLCRLQRQRSGHVEAQDFGPAAGESAAKQLVDPIVVERHQRDSWAALEVLAAQIVLVVPPGDGLGDVQVVGRHDQFQVADIAAEVQVAGPPAFVAHVDDPPQLDLLAVVGECARW